MEIEDVRALAAKIGAKREYGHFIGGQWVGGNSGETITLSNPATRADLATIQAGDAVDIGHAVDAAYAAFPSWSQIAPHARQKILLDMAAILRARLPEFAMMESLNNGKTFLEAHFDVIGSIGLLEFYSGAAFHLHGQVMDFADATMIVHREPIGVCAQIIPWNVPLLMAVMKLGPALAAGCTVVLKPAETVCMSVLEFMKAIAEILPPGVVNVVTGYGAAVGEALVTHPKVRKVAFTGSRPTAAKIIQYASRNIIPQTVELGGKSANIICEDGDLDAAAQSAVLSAISNKGEVCLAGTRIFVHRSVHEAFVEKFRAMLGAVRQGDPLDPKTQIGAQASQAQFTRVQDYLNIAREEGADIVCGGSAAQIEGLENGLFIQPTILDNVHNDMRVAREEIFGPVIGVIEWEDEAEMIRQVNDVEYGLGGGLWTKNLARAHRISRAMETGTVWINRYFNMKAGQPIGGYKQSGFGRENALETLNHYTVSKSVVVNLLEGPLGLPSHF